MSGSVRILPTEVELAIQLQPCLAERRTYERADRKHPCEFFVDQGSFHAFDLREPGPPKTQVQQSPVRYAGRRRVTPEMLSGCRKAPLMAVGINPNLPVFWPGKHNSVVPVFDDVLQYAHYYRYRALAKLQIPAGQYDRLRNGRADEPRGGEPLAPEGTAIDVEPADQKMYAAYQSLLDGLAAAMRWPTGSLKVGEELSYGNMVECGSPRWITRPDPRYPSLPVMSEDQRRGIVEECFFERRYFLRQLFQSLPRVLLVFGAPTRDAMIQAMGANFVEGSPRLGEAPEELLRRRVVLRYGDAPDGQELRARVLFVPHASGNGAAFDAVRAQVVAALVEEARAGVLEFDRGTGHLRRSIGGCTFCDNELYRIGPCEYRSQLVPLAPGSGAVPGESEPGPPALRERAVQEDLLRRFMPSTPGPSVGDAARDWAGAPERSVLLGRIVTMDAEFTVIADGALYVRDGAIEAVQEREAPPPRGYEDAPRLATDGTIYPGLIDLHNHLAYDVLPPWPVPKRYDDRSQWRRAPQYAARLGLMRRLTDGDRARAVARYVEVKALLGGSTTLQGLRSRMGQVGEAMRGLVRNIELGDHRTMPSAGSGVMDLDVSNAGRVERFRAAVTNESAAYLYHLSEGLDDAARRPWRDLVRLNLLGPGLVGIHCLSVPEEGFRALAEAGASVVWSPTSNLMLYGSTLSLAPVLSSGVRWILGCDWSPTGGKNPLFELKVARAVAEAQGVQLRARDLVAAVTARAAAAIRWQRAIGRIAAGLRADLVVLAGASADPYEQLIAAIESDIRLVVIDGVPRAGTRALFDAARVPQDGRESVAVGGGRQSLWLRDSGSPLDGFTLERAAAILERQMMHPDEAEWESSDFAPGADFRLALDEELAPLPPLPEDSVEAAALPDVLPQSPDALTVLDDHALWRALAAIEHFPPWLSALRDYYAS